MPPLRLPAENTQPRDRSRDKALLIAIEYKWPKHESVIELNTPHKDLNRVHQHLISHWGYHEENITRLWDGPKGEVDESMIPTRGNIFREIDNLVADIRAGDRRVFFFAGHCYQIKNRSGTEWDGKDEVILTAKHKGPPDETIDYAFTDPIRQGLIIDNELREKLVNSIPCGAKLVAIADTCHSGTLFDLDWHWHCDTQDKLRTIPSPPLTGRANLPIQMTPAPSRKASRSSRRHHSRKTIKGKASEYAYKFMDKSEDHARPSSPTRNSVDHPHKMKTLFSDWKPTEDDQSIGQDSSYKENRPTGHRDGSNHSERPTSPRGWGVSDICLSPAEEKPEEIPEVTSLSSAEDHQSAWAKSENDTMTSLLLDIIEELNHRPVPIQEITRLLKRKMQTARHQTMEAYYESRKGSLTEKKIKMLNRMQQPQLGSLRRDAKHTVFEL